ncbi:MAG: endonuclease/exonuclease/phosphatase family protein [Cellvibrionaceae bacterium]|nr:endonuclease/exonuclease/phosphatase family protein [Cellvibrionaceae bacterium]
MFELLSHLRLHYLLCLSISLVVFLVFRDKKYASVAVIAVTVNALPLLAFYYGGASERQVTIGSRHTSIKLMLSNVLSSNTNYSALLALVKTEKPDVLILQEVTADWLQQTGGLSLHYPHRIAHPQEDNFGIALFSKFPLQGERIANWGGFKLPSIETQLVVAGRKLLLLATHPLPPLNASYHRGRNSQLEQVSRRAKASELPTIVMGDLNLSLWSADYQRLLDVSGLHNVRKGFGILPSWPANLGVLSIPIDHCLTSRHFAIRDVKTGTNVGSDHLPLIVALDF